MHSTSDFIDYVSQFPRGYDTPSHTLVDESTGQRLSLQIPVVALDEVYAHFSKFTRSGGYCMFTECPKRQQYVPILVDIDIKRLMECPESDINIVPLIEWNDIEEILNNIYEVLLEYIPALETPIDPIQTHAFIFTKAPYLKRDGDKTYIKHGCHIQLPFLYVQNAYIRDYFYAPLKARISADRHCMSWVQGHDRDLLVDDLTNKPWLLYGAAKSEASGQYKLTDVVQLSTGERYSDPAEWYNISFKRRCILYASEGTTDREFAFDEFESILPRLLSIRDTPLKAGYFLEFKDMMKKRAPSLQDLANAYLDIEESDERLYRMDDDLPGTSSRATNAAIQRNLEEARIYLMLAPEISDDHDPWWKMGQYLYNVSRGCQEGLALWMDWTQAGSRWGSESRNPRSMRSEWTRIGQRYYNSEFKVALVRIKQMCTDAYPDRYIDIVHRSRDWIERIELTDRYVAEEMYTQYKSRYICADMKSGRWFYFERGIWSEMDEAHRVREDLTGPFAQEHIKILKSSVNTLKSELQIELAAEPMADNNSLKQRMSIYDSKLCILDKLYHSARCQRGKRDYIKECGEKFYVPRFITRLDSNPKLLGLRNGMVLDMTGPCLRNASIRPAVADDYLSLSIGIDYDPSILPTLEECEIYDQFMTSTFVDVEVRDFFLTVASSCLRGGNLLKHCYCLIGERSNNSKSTVIKILNVIFGTDYMTTVPDSVIVGHTRNASGSADPALARTAGKRIIVVNEPDADQCVQQCQLKMLCGNDNFFARDLYESGKRTHDISPQFKLFLVANKMPRITDSGDAGFWNRTQVIPFDSQFVPLDEFVLFTDEQRRRNRIFPMDPMLDDKIPTIAKVMLYRMIDRLREMDFATLSIPAVIRAAGANLRAACDVYFRFDQKHITRDMHITEETGPRFKDLWESFQLFMQISTGDQKYSQDGFRKYLVAKYGLPGSDDTWAGIQLYFAV